MPKLNMPGYTYLRHSGGRMADGMIFASAQQVAERSLQQWQQQYSPYPGAPVMLAQENGSDTKKERTDSTETAQLAARASAEGKNA